MPYEEWRILQTELSVIVIVVPCSSLNNLVAHVHGLQFAVLRQLACLYPTMKKMVLFTTRVVFYEIVWYVGSDDVQPRP